VKAGDRQLDFPGSVRCRGERLGRVALLSSLLMFRWGDQQQIRQERGSVFRNIMLLVFSQKWGEGIIDSGVGKRI